MQTKRTLTAFCASLVISSAVVSSNAQDFHLAPGKLRVLGTGNADPTPPPSSAPTACTTKGKKGGCKDHMDMSDPPAMAPSEPTPSTPTLPPAKPTKGPRPTKPPAKAPSDGSDSPSDMPSDFPSSQPLDMVQTIDEIITTTDEYSTLAAGLDLADLFGVLSESFNSTVFAPDNEAFEALDQEFLGKLLTPSWFLHLQNLLTYHMSFPQVDRILSSEFTDGMEIDMLNGELVGISVTADAISVLSESSMPSTVVGPDNIASNGNVHTIDAVLEPSFFVTDLFSLGEKIPGHEILFELIELAGIVDVVGEGDFTIFAPTDAAFEALGQDTLDELKNDIPALTAVLANHVVEGVYSSLALVDGLQVTSFGGLPLLVTKGLSARTIMINAATVNGADTLANNGIAHSIDSVILASTGDATQTDSSGGNLETAEGPASTSSETSGHKPLLDFGFSAAILLASVFLASFHPLF